MKYETIESISWAIAITVSTFLSLLALGGPPLSLAEVCGIFVVSFLVLKGMLWILR